MADKQIIQLPSGIAAFDGDSNFVFQNDTGVTDYKIRATQLATFLGNLGVGDFNIYGGSVNPNNALGVPRDLYFKSDGSIYKKVGNVWQLKVSGSSSPAVVISPPTGSYEYTLSPTELAAVNAFTRWPNFTAIIGGNQFFDVFPQYTGSVGNFTQIKVQLHSTNEQHLVQFS